MRLFSILVASCRNIWPYVSSQNYVSASKQKESHCITLIVGRLNLLFTPCWGPLESSKCISSRLSLEWEPLTQLDGPNHLPKHPQGNLHETDMTWVILSPHLPYLVFIIKTCLLKYMFLLPNMESTRLLHSLLYFSSELNEYPSNLARDYRWFL